MADIINQWTTQANNFFGGASEGAFFSSAAFDKLAFFGKVLGYFAIFLIGGLLVYKFWVQYKIKITVKKCFGNGGIDIVYDKAKIIKDKEGKEKLVLFKTRHVGKALTCPVPEARFKGKLGKYDHYELWMDDNFQLHPCELPEIDDLTSIKTRIRPQERDAWAHMEQRALEERVRKKSDLEKYMPSAIVIMAFVVAFLIIFFATKHLGSSMTNLAGSFNEISQNCLQLRGGA